MPLGTVSTVRPISAPLVLTRYNMYPAAAIQGNAAAGFSTGQSLAATEELARKELPRSMAIEWSEIAYLERMAGNTGMVVFGLWVMFVFLVRAALYESWSLPLAVILVVPMCVLSSLAGVWWAKMDINVFTQIGFVVLIGLASKNAILIVEFAKSRRAEGVSHREATLHACELRLRPIMMTSFAFILGVLPLVIAEGAGAEMRRTLGTAVFSGMLGVTFFGILLTPVFFYVLDCAADMHLFSTGWVAVVGRAGLNVVSLSFIRRPVRRYFQKLADASPEHRRTGQKGKPSVQPAAPSNSTSRRSRRLNGNGLAIDGGEAAGNGEPLQIGDSPECERQWPFAPRGIRRVEAGRRPLAGIVPNGGRIPRRRQQSTWAQLLRRICLAD